MKIAPLQNFYPQKCMILDYSPNAPLNTLLTDWYTHFWNSYSVYPSTNFEPILLSYQHFYFKYAN